MIPQPENASQFSSDLISRHCRSLPLIELPDLFSKLIICIELIQNVFIIFNFGIQFQCNVSQIKPRKLVAVLDDLTAVTVIGTDNDGDERNQGHQRK